MGGFRSEPIPGQPPVVGEILFRRAYLPHGILALPDPLADDWWDYNDMMERVAAGHAGILSPFTTGAGCTWTNKAAEASHPGIWVGNTGTTTTGHARLAAADDSIMFSNGRIRAGFWIKTGTALSDAVNRWHLYAGVIDNPSPTAVAEGMMIRYRDNVNGGRWQGVVANGGGWTMLDLGVVVATSTWYFLEMEINAAGNSVEFFINGAPVGTIASGPAVNSTAELRSGILKSAGTLARDADWDAYYIRGDLVVAR